MNKRETNRKMFLETMVIMCYLKWTTPLLLEPELVLVPVLELELLLVLFPRLGPELLLVLFPRQINQILLRRSGSLR